MAQYLVTGGAGFIGSHLVDGLLAAGHGVRIIDDLSTGSRDNVSGAPGQAELIVGDVADRDLVGRAMAGMTGCFHLAAIASVQRGNEEWLATHNANLTGAITVYDAAREHGGLPVVYASSAAVYGDNADVPLDEDAATQPLRAYGADKLGCEHHARVAGLVKQDEGEVELPIITDWANRPRQKISQDGKWALTRYRVLQRDPDSDSTLVSLEPFTGRSHQLRIHMRELGHPILGCDLYAPEAIMARSPRLLLHACRLGLTHPASGEWQVYQCPPPFA